MRGICPGCEWSFGVEAQVLKLQYDVSAFGKYSSAKPTRHHQRTFPPKYSIPSSIQPTMADKLRAQQQLEALQARYIGTGHADTTKFEWTSNIARDTFASYIGHPPVLEYIALGLGEPREKVRAQMIEKMIRPVGKPPEVSCKCLRMV